MIYIEGLDNGFMALTGPFISIGPERYPGGRDWPASGITDCHLNSQAMTGNRVLPGRNAGANRGKPRYFWHLKNA
jgi:hypothetical protein